MISTKRVVRVTKAEKLCNPSESLQVGRYCRIRRPLFFFSWLVVLKNIGSGQGGTLFKRSIILWLRTWIYNRHRPISQPRISDMTEKSNFNELDFQHWLGLNLQNRC